MSTAVLLAPARYVVGLDVAADAFVACLLTRAANGSCQVLGAPKSFANSARGFAPFHRWLTQRLAGQPQAQQVLCVLEATGVYHEALAYGLVEQGLAVSVCPPARVRQYARSLPGKSKTDALDAHLLARLGLERPLPRWQPFAPSLRTLRTLVRERAALLAQRTQLTNRCHAYQHAVHGPAGPLQRLQAQRALLDGQLAELEAELHALQQADPVLAPAVGRLTTIPGLGQVTALVLLGETNGFAGFANGRQLASYAGLDVVAHQSGTSVLGRARLSKRGNAHLRTALYWPAVTAARCNPQQRALYERLRERHPQQRKIALGAIMRKLLLLAFTLHRTQQDYDPNRSQPTPNKVAPTLSAEATQDGATGATPPLLAPNVRKMTRPLQPQTP